MIVFFQGSQIQAWLSEPKKGQQNIYLLCDRPDTRMMMMMMMMMMMLMRMCFSRDLIAPPYVHTGKKTLHVLFAVTKVSCDIRNPETIPGRDSVRAGMILLCGIY